MSARTVLALARVEAWLLVRSVLVLAGMLAGAVVIWFLIRPTEPLWWRADWRIGGGQLVLGMAVLAAAQLNAGRPRRDAMAELYASFPATAGTRTLAHLIGLAGAVPAGLLLLGAAAVVIQLSGAVGSASIAVLAGGLLLVIAAGAAGVAIGVRFAHPLAGVLGALALFISSATTHLASGGGIWLLPWEVFQDDLSQLPGRLTGYPPAGAHAAELAGLAALAAIVALAVTIAGGRSRARLALAGVVAVAVICLAGVLQGRPLPTAELNHLVTEIADPASAQDCVTASQARYCLYPGFGRDLPSLRDPVNGVLAHLPARPAQPLTIRQAALPSLDGTFTHGHPDQQIARWNTQLQAAPGDATTASAVYLSVGSWPAAGGQLADARFDVALAAADWAVRLPFPVASGQPCVALDQAREAIAIWLAILATRPAGSELQAGLNGSGGGFTATEVSNTMVRTWNYPGISAGYLTGATPQLTAAGYLLASAMTRLPEQKVSRVLAGAWSTWLNWHTGDARLAAALGIAMPSVPGLPGLAGPAGNAPQNPVCTS
ncbi:MAG TPA: hypothetical protein VKU77_27575 [Streptosporangiaceae bacterium]|nr:hypothetical protein [Streptosporangiaceae bacterium]